MRQRCERWRTPLTTLIPNLGIQRRPACSPRHMERILRDGLCFITTHWTALAVYYSTWVNTGWHLSLTWSRADVFQRHPGPDPSAFSPSAQQNRHLCFPLRSQLPPLMDTFSSGQFPTSRNTLKMSSRFNFQAPKTRTGQILCIFSHSRNAY